jgi:hypothetical protein
MYITTYIIQNIRKKISYRIIYHNLFIFLGNILVCMEYLPCIKKVWLNSQILISLHVKTHKLQLQADADYVPVLKNVYITGKYIWWLSRNQTHKKEDTGMIQTSEIGNA